MNDQFGADAPLEKYLDAIEAASPVVRAIGVTDYYVLDTYEAVAAAKAEGRLVNCDLIFPNVELRLGLRTTKGKFVNLHLLACPDDADHVAQIKRFLSRITFEAFGDTFACTRDELMRLGRTSDATKASDSAALEHGANQFKVSLPQLQATYRQNDWAKANILVAISGTETDGTSGLKDAADRTLREEMEKFAHVIFASSPAQREFWLGLRAANADELEQRYGGLKPCLHGSDAHKLPDVAVPDGARYSWVKGALKFDSLRQACIDPAGRAFVGPAKPIGGIGSQVISRVTIKNAPWATTPTIELNAGLVSIIGARGSGKTALADIIAAGCDALPSTLNSSSFLARAQNLNVKSGPRPNLLSGASVKVDWESGETATRMIDGSHEASTSDYPRVRYLSQQFVDDLCSADGVTDVLLSEIERVIFEAHEIVDRDGAIDFADMRVRRTNRYRIARGRTELSLAEISEAIGAELEKHRQVLSLRTQVTQKDGVVKGYETDRAKLVTVGSEKRVARLAELTEAADTVRSHIRFFNTQREAVLTLQDEVKDFRANRAPAVLAQSKTKHKSVGIKDEDWVPFLLDYKGDVDAALTAREAEAAKAVLDWKGATIGAGTADAPLIADDADLTRLPLNLLSAEIARLQGLVSTDAQVAGRFKTISTKIDEEKATLQALKERLEDAEKAQDRLTTLRASRDSAYREIFASLISEQELLAKLYAPLMTKLAGAKGTLAKMSFSVRRIADIDRWSIDGEKLFDLRSGSFKGRGTLKEFAEGALKPAWETGDADAVSGAMAAFLAAHQTTLLDNANVPRSDEANFREWAKRFAKWLYGTTHIALNYSIDFDGVDIRHLSPGTRGIVLLLLYLALDDGDARPLVIDQPEENLDPKSIFEELVQLFIDAKLQRQVIMVTHNANLVINTDADQIIVAEVGPHPRGSLPPIVYSSGGLEEAPIRKAVCDILEGGESAFKERARRLRVRLER